ncbi:MAG: hypothetical protein COV46_01075 [Deltaproteobacteria bacterium CG11_big_fil_rev_8_21_14_0_20_49_13]|nr:MAG: hypothetical protein COV46_01075 [Deltaproteobacteria bacterium CG11_big_fil_rev_8_21_14_0_20_49_13]
MSENFKKQVERPDRTLGDEWSDWDGDSKDPIKDGAWLFLNFSLIVFLLMDTVLGVLYYFILPRLAMIRSWLPAVVLTLIVLWILSSTLFWTQLTMTVTRGRNCFFANKQIFFVFDLVFGRVFKLARLLKISRDRMGHSFVQVSNAVVRAVNRSPLEKRIMILLPRCLTKENIQGIIKLKETYPVEVYTVSGGELARKKVKEYNPTAIIGVACERDLVSGIRDVASKIPVIGIANRRPDGPCKDTLVDIEEIRRAVEFYLK